EDAAPLNAVERHVLEAEVVCEAEVPTPVAARVGLRSDEIDAAAVPVVVDGLVDPVAVGVELGADVRERIPLRRVLQGEGHLVVVSADGHVLEPTDLFLTRLPQHLRERAVWEEDFEVADFKGDGDRVFRRLHCPGFEGWTISRYRQTGGRTPEGDPELILEDMDLDGVDVAVMHPNLSLFGLYSDDHELSMAHARVYNDYIIERFTPYFTRIAPTAPVPITDIDDAVAEIERVAAGGFRGILLPAIPPQPYHSADFEPVWAAAQHNGVHVFFHCATGGVKVKDPDSSTLRTVMQMADQVNRPMDGKLASQRMMTQ